MPSTSLMLLKKWLPSPSPCEAPLTIPAISTTCSTAETYDLGWYMSHSFLKRSSGTGTTALLGSIVQKGQFYAGTLRLDRTLQVVDLPTFGSPTIPILRVFPGLPQRICCSYFYYFFLGGMWQLNNNQFLYQLKLNIKRIYKNRSFMSLPLVNLSQDAVPKQYSVVNRIQSSFENVLVIRIVLFAKKDQQIGAFGSVVVTVDFNVPVKVVFEGPTVEFAVFDSLDKLGEHVGDGIFPSKEKLPCSVGDALEDSRARIQVELLHIVHCSVRVNQLLNVSIGVLVILQLRDIFHKLPHSLCVSSNFLHASQVKLKMGKILIWDIGLIRLLPNYNFIDKPCRLYISARSPEPFGVCKVSLKVFDQLEEVPYCPAMPFHKQPQIIDGTQGVVNWMRVQPFLGIFKCWVVQQQSLHSQTFTCHPMLKLIIRKLLHSAFIVKTLIIHFSILKAFFLYLSLPRDFCSKIHFNASLFILIFSQYHMNSRFGSIFHTF